MVEDVTKPGGTVLTRAETVENPFSGNAAWLHECVETLLSPVAKVSAARFNASSIGHAGTSKDRLRPLAVDPANQAANPSRRTPLF